MEIKEAGCAITGLLSASTIVAILNLTLVPIVMGIEF
jgi:hypothetical protein